MSGLRYVARRPGTTPATQARNSRPAAREKSGQVLLALVALLGTLACEAQPTIAPTPSITIRNHRVELEFARTRAEQARGLGGRDSLAWNHGMLFEYSRPGFPGFWMKDMRFDIDIVWIRDLRIVDISHRVKYSPEGPGQTVRPRELVETVLEVPAGFAQAHGWRVGDRVTIDRGEPAPEHPTR